MGDAFGLLMLGFLAAVVGVSLPGLLNMTAVKIFKNEGRKNATSYLIGALGVILIQTFIAVFAAKIIDSNPFISNALHEIGFVIFTILTIYFIGFAKKIDQKKQLRKQEMKPKQNRFFYGAMLALLNVFPIPYYAFLSVTLASYHLPIFEKSYNFIFSIGVVLGSALMFYLYIAFFNKSSKTNTFVLKNVNYFIGVIIAVVAMITLYKILK